MMHLMGMQKYHLSMYMCQQRTFYYGEGHGFEIAQVKLFNAFPGALWICVCFLVEGGFPLSWSNPRPPHLRSWQHETVVFQIYLSSIYFTTNCISQGMLKLLKISININSFLCFYTAYQCKCSKLLGLKPRRRKKFCFWHPYAESRNDCYWSYVRLKPGRNPTHPLAQMW